MTTIQLDGREHEVPDGSTLAALVAALGHAPHAVTTAVDGRFVPRDQRADHVLRAGTTVLLFQPIVGG
jgi:sulfur carrier protein